MSRIQDRKQQRREYLWKKEAAYTLSTFLSFLMVPCIGIALIALMEVVSFLCHYWVTADYHDLVMAILYMGIAFLLGGASWLLFRSARQTKRDAEQLPYVPPVTAATLPNEEVLLRGSDASTQEQSSVLLRGTQSGEETDGQELLRSSQGQD